MAISVLHGTVRVVAFELDDAGYVVSLESFADNWSVSQRVDLSAFDLLIAADGNLAVGEHLAVGGGCPWLLIEQFGVSFGALNVQSFGRTPEIGKSRAFGGGSEFVDGVDSLVRSRQ